MMRKKINLLLAIIIVVNLFIIPVNADVQNTEFGETCNYTFDFSDNNSNSLDSILSLEKTGTVTNQTYSLVTEADQTTALAWKSGGFTHGSTSSLIVNLPDEIDTTSGEIVIDMTVKLGKRHLLGFPILVGVSEETNFGFGKFANVDNIRLYSDKDPSFINGAIIAYNNADADTSNDINLNKTYLLTWNNAEAYYYDYKFVIDTASQRFRMYHKKATDENWNEIYKGMTLKKENSDEYIILDGAIKTGALPEKLTALKFKITENCNDSRVDANINDILTKNGIDPSEATEEQKAAARIEWRNTESIYYFKNISVSKNLPVEKTTNLVFDYTKKSTTDDTALMGITTEKGSSWSVVTSNTSIAVDEGVNVLEWSNKDFSTRQAGALMKIKLPQKVDLDNGPVTMEVTAKLDQRQSIGFAKPIGTNSQGDLQNGSKVGILMYSNTDNIRIDGGLSSEENSIRLYDEETMSIKEASSQYYTYKYVLDPKTDTFRFFIKPENELSFIEPFKNKTLSIGVDDLVISDLQFGIADLYNQNTITGDDIQSQLASETKHYIKNIKIKQGLEIVSSTLKENGSFDDDTISFTFNDAIKTETVNADTISLFDDGQELVFGTDYTTSVSDNTVEFKILSDIAFGSDVKLVIGNINESAGYSRLADSIEINAKKLKVNDVYKNSAIFSVGTKYSSILGEEKVTDYITAIENTNAVVDAKIINTAFSKSFAQNTVSTAELTASGLSVITDADKGVVIVSETSLNEAQTDVTALAMVNGVYISKNGADSNLGTATKPVKTLDAALEKSLYIREQHGFNPTIYYLDDKYYAAATTHITSKYSGSVIKGYDNSTSVLGSVKIENSKIRQATASDCDGRLNTENLKNIVRIDISGYPKENFFKEKEDGTVFMPELVDNGSIKTISRWPDKSWAATGEVVDGESEASFVTTNSLDWDASANDIRICGFWYTDYRCSAGKVTGFLKENHTIDVAYSSADAMFNPNRRYYVYNIPEEITAPGEYYINQDEMAVYYYPENRDAMDIEITALPDGIINIEEDTSDITIKNITLANTQGTAILAGGSTQINISGCNVRFTGGNGITIKKSDNCNIISNTFDNNGTQSVYIEGGDRPSLTNSNNNVTDNVFTNGARIVKTYSPFVQAEGIGVNIKNNYFYNHMHSAIMFEGNDHIIENNIFDTIVTETEDSGGIYSGVDATYRGNVIRNNIFKNIRSFKPDERYADVFGIYMDDLIQGVEIEDNLFYNCTAAVNIGGGRSNKCIGNLVYDCYEGIHYGYRANIETDSMKSNYGYIWRTVNDMEQRTGYNEELWFEKYNDYKILVQDLELQETDATNTEATILKGAMYTDNITLVERGDVEADVATICDQAKNNGTVTNNYFSNDLSLATLNGNEVDIANSLKSSGYSVPDVTAAGPLTLDTSYIQNPDEEYVLSKDRIDYSDNYKFRSTGFNGFSILDSVSKIKEFDVSTSSWYGASFTGNGKLKINDGVSVTFKTNGNFVGNNAVAVLFNGNNLKITIKGDKNCEFTASAENKNVEYRIDNENDKIYVYNQTENGMVKVDEISVECPSYVNEIVLTASTGGAEIDYLALNKLGNNINVSEYFSSDFDDAVSGQSVQDYDDKFFIYDPFGRSGEIIEDDGSGNKAIKFYQNEYSTVRMSHLELLLPPISTYDKVLIFEYAIKFSGESGRLRRVDIEGFESEEPAEVVSVTSATEPNFTLRALTQNGVQIATKDEFASGYVPMRVVIDAKNSTWTLYEKVNGEYEQVTTKTNAIIPEYIDKLHFEIIGEAGETNPRTYYIDDISVYSSEGLYLSDESGEKTTIQAGNNVFLKPEYLPGSDIGCVFAAIYNGEGKLVDIDKKAYLPNIQLGLNVPDDADNTYNIKYFEWKNINSMIPVNDVKLFDK